MGSTHFQTKTLKRVGTEMALHVLAYNLKRVINIMDIAENEIDLAGTEIALVSGDGSAWVAES